MKQKSKAALGEQPSICRQLCGLVDWQRKELKALRGLWRSGDAEGAAVGLIRHLRRRRTPRLGYTKAYVQRLRAASTPRQRRAAGEAWDRALTGELLLPHHHNALAALGAEAIILGATPERCSRMAARVMEYAPRWRDGFWGVTYSVVDVLRFLWAVPECADEHLVPLFGWLLEKSEAEWAWARTWDENDLGSSGHNWWAHTFTGFWMLGMFFPEFRGVQRFQALAQGYLEREASTLFEADGWSKEGSPGYHMFAAMSLTQFAHLAQLNGIGLSPRLRSRLRELADAEWRLLTPDGCLPEFGDDELADWSGVLRCRAARFRLPESKFVLDSLKPGWKPPYTDLMPDAGVDLLPAYRRLHAVRPASLDTRLPVSGWHVMRQDWSSKSDYVALLAGPLGQRITSHKHADLFSLELYSHGRRILVDNGYGTRAEDRDDDAVRLWRVSTSAHNTLTVDDADQVPVVREFLFGGVTAPVVDDWRSECDYAYFSGVHEGYIREPVNVMAVRRKLFYLRGGYWILIDRVTPTTKAPHTYKLHFHVNAPGKLMSGGRFVTEGKGGNLLVVPVPGASGAARIEDNPHPIPGYENPRHLFYTRRAKERLVFVTLLVPFQDRAMPKVEVSLIPVECDGRVLTAWEATALAINWNGRRDLYVDQHMHWNLPWRVGNYEGESRLFHSEVKKRLPRVPDFTLFRRDMRGQA